MKNKNKAWFVYILRCKGNLLYTGITSDLERRMRQHRSGNGCRFTRCRIPVKLIYREQVSGMSDALKREAEIKRFPRKKKLAVIRNRAGMRKSIFAIALTVFLAGASAFANDAPLETYRLKDGRDWIQMGRDAKVSFIMGLSDLQAYHFLRKDILVEEDGVKKTSFATYLSQFLPFDHSVNDAVNWLDQFYWDGLNTNIPVIVAFRIAALKFGLGPEEAVDKVIEDARQGIYGF
jgi:putative endonuclease